MRSVIGFALRGTVADIDGTVLGEPLHPAAVLVLEVAGAFSRIVLPRWLSQAAGDALCVGAAVEVAGELQGFPTRAVHVATELRLVPTLH
jgi:hypothetical protein